MSSAHKRVVSSVCTFKSWPWNSPRETRLFEPPFCGRQLGFAPDKFETVHVTVVSADRDTLGYEATCSRQFNEMCRCLFACCLSCLSIKGWGLQEGREEEEKTRVINL